MGGKCDLSPNVTIGHRSRCFPHTFATEGWVKCPLRMWEWHSLNQLTILFAMCRSHVYVLSKTKAEQVRLGVEAWETAKEIYLKKDRTISSKKGTESSQREEFKEQDSAAFFRHYPETQGRSDCIFQTPLLTGVVASLNSQGIFAEHVHCVRHRSRHRHGSAE